jgi:hypothetical protein
VTCSSGVPAETHTVGGTVTGLKAPLRLVLDKDNAIRTVAPAGGAAVPFTFPVALALDTDFRVVLLEQPAGQTCLIPHSGSRVAHANITDINVTCIDNVTDPLSGTFTQFGGEMAVTFYPGGVYVYASVEDDTTCSTNNGNGVEVGAYRYNAAAGTITLVSNLLDTNGANCASKSLALQPLGQHIDEQARLGRRHAAWRNHDMDRNPRRFEIFQHDLQRTAIDEIADLPERPISDAEPVTDASLCRGRVVDPEATADPHHPDLAAN